MNKKYIDTHTHVNLRAFKDDAKETIQRALDNGVAIVNVGTQIDTSRHAVELLKDFPQDVYAVVGLHPSHTYAHDYEDDEEVKFKTREEHFDTELYRQLASHARVVGIGECGLDYYRLPDDRDHQEIKQLQRTAFDEQIKLALELDKALCINCRPSDGTNDAYEDLLGILEPLCHSRESGNPEDGSLGPDFHKDDPTPNPSPERGRERKGLRFEVHCYTGDAATAMKFVELGGFIGLNGIITFDKTGRSEDVVKTVPLENIILETDAPYLSPKSQRGKRNEPSFLPEVAEKIAEWKNISVDEVAEVTTNNAKQLFKIQ